MNKSRPGKRTKQDNSNDWLTTYSDMITLLLAFFVIIISVSDLNESKVDDLRHIRGPSDTEPLKYEEIKHELEVSHLSGFVIKALRDGIVIEINSDNLYLSGSANIQKQIMPSLIELIDNLKKNNLLEFNISINGHTDNEQIHTQKYPSNWELSSARAINVLHFFAEHGVPESSLEANAFADTRPKNSIENKAENRRVEIYIQKYGVSNKQQKQAK